MVECDGCGSEPVDETVTISCDGTDFTPPPSSAGVDDTSVEIIGGTPSPADDAGASSEVTSSADSRMFGRRDSWRRGTGALAALVAAVVALLVV